MRILLLLLLLHRLQGNVRPIFASRSQKKDERCAASVAVTMSNSVTRFIFIIIGTEESFNYYYRYYYVQR